MPQKPMNVLILISENHTYINQMHALMRELSNTYPIHIDMHSDLPIPNNYDLIWLVGMPTQAETWKTLQTVSSKLIYQPDPQKNEVVQQILTEIYQHLDTQMQQYKGHNRKIQLKLLFDQINIAEFTPSSQSTSLVPNHNIDFYFGDTHELKTAFFSSQQQLLQPCLNLPLFPITTEISHDSFEKLHSDPVPFILTTGTFTPTDNLLGLCVALSDSPFPLLIVAPIHNSQEQAYFEYCQLISNGRLIRLDPLPESLWQAALAKSRLLVIPGFTDRTEVLLSQAQALGTQTVCHLPNLTEIYPNGHWHFESLNLTDLRQTIFQAWRHAQEKSTPPTLVPSKLLERYWQIFTDLGKITKGSPITIWRGQIKPWSPFPDQLEQLKENHVYTLNAIHTSSLSTWPIQDIKNKVFLHAPTILATALLRQTGWEHVHNAQEVEPLFSHPDIKGPVALAEHYAFDRNKLNLVTLYTADNSYGWQESLKIYLQTFQNTDNCLLYIYISSEQTVVEDELEEKIITTLEAYGHDPENIPDVHILISEHPLTDDAAFFTNIDVGLFFPTQYIPSLEEGLKSLQLCQHIIGDLAHFPMTTTKQLLPIYTQKMELCHPNNHFDCIYIHSLNHFSAYQSIFSTHTLALTDDINIFNELSKKGISAIILVDHLTEQQYEENIIQSQTITDQWAHFFQEDLQYREVDVARFCAYEMLYPFRGALNLKTIWQNIQQLYTIKSIYLPQELSRPQIWDTSDGPYPDMTVGILAYLAEQQQIPVHWLPPQNYSRRYHNVSQSTAHRPSPPTYTVPTIQATHRAPIILLGSITDYFEFTQVKELLDQQAEPIPFLFFNDVPSPTQIHQDSEISFTEMLSSNPIPVEIQTKLQSVWIKFTQQRHRFGQAFIFSNPYFEFQLKFFFSRILHSYQVIDATHTLYQLYQPAIAIVGNIAEGYKSCRAAALKQLGTYVIYNTHGLIGSAPHHKGEITKAVDYIFYKNYLCKQLLIRYMPTNISIVGDLRRFKHSSVPKQNQKPVILWITSDNNYGSIFLQAHPNIFLKNLTQLEQLIQSGEFHHIIKNHPLYDFHNIYNNIQKKYPEYVTTIAGEQSLEEVLSSYNISVAIIFNSLSSSMIEILKKKIPTFIYGEAINQAYLKNSVYPIDKPLFVNNWNELTTLFQQITTKPSCSLQPSASQTLLYELSYNDPEYSSSQIYLQHLNSIYGNLNLH